MVKYSTSKDIKILKILSYCAFVLFIVTSYLRAKTLKPWSDEIVSLVSNLNFYNNLNFLGPIDSQYFISYSPGLTAGPISAIGAVASWIFTQNMTIIRFGNLVYLFLLSVGLTYFVFRAFKINLNLNFLLLNILILFSLTNTSWWYSILYLLPETICSVIFVNSVLLFQKNRNLSLFLMSFSVFFGDFLAY